MKNQLEGMSLKDWKFDGVHLKKIEKTTTEQGLTPFSGTVLVYNIEKNLLTILNDSHILEISNQSYLLYLKNAKALVESGEFRPINKKYHLNFFEELERQQQSSGLNKYNLSAKIYNYLMNINSERSHIQKEFSQLVVHAVEIIQEDYAQLEGIEELASQLAVSKNHLIRTFSAQLSETPGKYLEKIRLEQSAAILCTTDYNLDLIATMVGFSSGNYFGKVFKKAYGLTPKEYRTENRNKPATKEKNLVKKLKNIYLF